MLKRLYSTIILLLICSCSTLNEPKINGDHFFYNRDFLTAIDFYQIELENEEIDITKLRNLAYSYLRTDQIDKAFIEYDKVFNIDPTHYASLIDLIIYNYEEREFWESYQLALRMHKAHLSSLFAALYLSEVADELDIDHLQIDYDFASITEEDLYELYNIAEDLYLDELYDFALYIYLWIVELDNNQLDAHIRIVDITEIHDENLYILLDTLEEILRIEPENLIYLKKIRDLSMDLELYESVIEDYSPRIVELDPDDIDALFMTGIWYGKNENYKSAIELHEKVRDLDQNYPDIYRYLSYGEGSLKNYSKSLEYNKLHTEKNPKDISAWDDIADLASILGDYETELIANLTLVELEPDDLDRRYYTSRSYDKMGRFKEALDYSLLVLDKIESARDSDYIGYLALLYNKLGDKEEAINYFEKSLSIDPTNETTKGNLKEFYIITDNKEKAKDIEVDDDIDVLYNFILKELDGLDNTEEFILLQQMNSEDFDTYSWYELELWLEGKDEDFSNKIIGAINLLR